MKINSQFNLLPEIMAPAGSFASLQAAINAGCGSVYFGVHQLNMRSRSSHNFNLEELKEIADICSAANVRSYVTLNTLLYNHDLTLMKRIIDEAKKAGVSAVIVQDIAAIQYAHQIGMPIHASTQLSISNYEAVKFYSQFADTIVLAREVDLNMMADICNRIKEEKLCGPSGELLKIEVFVHGALCIAQSGRCQMSLLQNNTSAQRGACLQECRKQYLIKDIETGMEMRIRDSYILSPKDLCCLPFLDKLVEAGISVFKIEGRGRNPQYVDRVVRTYKEAVDAIGEGNFTEEKIKLWMNGLKEVFNRGFSEGYYLGKKLPEWSGFSRNRSEYERVFIGKVNHYFPKAKVAEINVQAHELTKGDKLVIMGKSTGVLYCDVNEMKRDDLSIEISKKSDLVTIPLTDRVRKNDKVYLLRKRNLNVLA